MLRRDAIGRDVMPWATPGQVAATLQLSPEHVRRIVRSGVWQTWRAPELKRRRRKAHRGGTWRIKVDADGAPVFARGAR